MKVIFANWLDEHLEDFDELIQLAVADFVVYVQSNGLKGLKGRNKSSVLPNPHTKKEQRRHAFAQKHCLWHYHLGVPCYVEQANGEFTSEYVLHYSYYQDMVVLIDIGTHPPFELPHFDKLAYQSS